MTFSQATASHIVPLLARLVLAAAFIPAGWNKLTDTATFNAEQAATLRSLGVAVRDEPDTGASAIHRATYRTTVTSASLGSAQGNAADTSSGSSNDADVEQDAGEAADSDAAAAPPAGPPSRPPTRPDTPAATPGPLPGEPVTDVPSRPSPEIPTAPRPDLAVTGAVGGTAMALHRVTLMVHEQGWPLPVVQAWTAMAVELIGGALLVIGLFSRLWGLGLAVTMGVAFWLTSWPLLQHMTLFELSVADFNRLFAQLGLLTLAFGILLTGAGGISLDRLLFRPAGAEVDSPAA